MKNIKKSNYKLDINDVKSVIIDDSGRSVACFSLNKHVAVDNDVINQLVLLSKKRGKMDARICLHNDRKSKLHNMVNLIYKRKAYNPHKHVFKSECYHMIEGIMKVKIFKNNGDLIDEHILDGNKVNIVRIGKNTFHTTESITEYAVFHESRIGPFSSSGDSTYLFQ